MKNKENSSVSVRKEWSAGIAGIFKGKVSNFNQHQIISFVVLIILALICLGGLNLNIAVCMPILIIDVVAIMVLVMAGFIRHCYVKPTDDFYETTTRILGVNKAIEITNMPASLVTREFIEAVAGMQFFENEPPVGLIEGEVTDDKSIRMLSEEERKGYKENERKAILQHQDKIKKQLDELKQSQLPAKQIKSE
jgi:hypothetical protein